MTEYEYEKYLTFPIGDGDGDGDVHMRNETRKNEFVSNFLFFSKNKRKHMRVKDVTSYLDITYYKGRIYSIHFPKARKKIKLYYKRQNVENIN